ncbi:MAG TPA: SPOR domain-containing protein [Thermoanaerobaculia bacterium]|jgi:septal ring-binding cell division protein DamX
MEEHTADDQSHYEISLTAGQAFVAFVLLLLSLAASFAFGLMLGKGQADERLIVQKETPVVTEAALTPKKAGDIVELGVQNDDFTGSDEDEGALAATQRASEPAAVTDTAAVAAPQIVEAADESEDAIDTPKPADAPKPAAEAAAAPQATPRVTTPAPAAVAAASKPASASKPVAMSKAPHLAQLLSTGDQKAAEALAVKLIDGGFSTAYVERGSNEKGPVFRVRVKFDSEQDARGAEPKLRAFSKDVWITAR